MARYVIALLKKDKSDKDLKRIMIEQLDVFLSEATTRFVDRLFDAIASEEYLTMPAPLAPAASVAELELDHDLDGVADIEAVLAAAASPPPPPPPPKEIVIKPEGTQQQQVNNDISSSSREPASDTPGQQQSSSSSASIATDASTTGTHSTKPAFDVGYFPFPLFINDLSNCLLSAENQRLSQQQRQSGDTSSSSQQQRKRRIRVCAQCKPACSQFRQQRYSCWWSLCR